MYSVILSRLSFLQKQKARKILSRCHPTADASQAAPPPSPRRATCFVPDVSPHMLRCFPTRVEFLNFKTEVDKEGEGEGAECGMVLHGVQDGVSSRSPSLPILQGVS